MKPKQQRFAGFVASRSGQARIHTPFQQVKIVNLPAEIEIPAERIVFVEEVDEANQGTNSMLGINDVRTVDSLPSPPAIDPKRSITLEDDRYLVAVSRSNGSITRILDKQGGIDLIREPRLADNFRFSLPIPGKEPWQTIEANYIRGSDQRLSSFDAGNKKLTLRWQRPLVNYLGEKFDVSAAMGIELTPAGVLFSLKIQNQSRYQIGEVFFPLIGGIQGIGHFAAELKATDLIRPARAGGATASGIFRQFTDMCVFGDQGPEQFYSYPKDMPESWLEFSTRNAPKRSVYIAHRPCGPPKGAAAGVVAGQFRHNARGWQLAPARRTKGPARGSQRVLCRHRQCPGQPGL